MLRYIVVLVLGLSASSMAMAAPWADALFDQLSKEFGTVPRGPVITHPFHITNKLNVPVRIEGVRVSCGCVTARALTNHIPPGKTSAIVAQMDTSRFLHSRTVTIYVTLSAGRQMAEVRLWVRANSREDVGVYPDTLAFGRIKRGASPKKTATISLYGRSDYQILRCFADSNYVHVECRPSGQNNHGIQYQLSARLRSDTPPGRWYTDIWVTTNNPSMPRLRVPLTVEIESALSVSPSTVLKGRVKAGTEAVRKIIVRVVVPFRIKRVLGTDKQLQVYSNTANKKSVHVLTVTLRPHESGQLDRQLFIETDLPTNNRIDFRTRALVESQGP